MSASYKIGTGLVKVFSITGTTKNPGIFDISRLYGEISYYESIYDTSASLSALIIDSTDLKSSLPVIGGEVIAYEFSDSFPDTRTISGKMRLFKMNNRNRLKQGVDSYNIHCITNEMMFDQREDAVVNRSYYKPTTDIVKDIFSEYIKPIGNKDLVSVSKTDGIMNQTFARVSPFTAIKYLATEAKSIEEDSGSLFLFFETSEGYHFRTLDSLFQQDPIYSFVYAEDQIGNLGESELQQNRIVALKEEDGFDLLYGLNRGEYGTLSSSYDPIAKKYSKKTYTHLNDYKKLKHIGGGKNILSDSIINEFGAVPSFEKFIPTNKNASEIDYVIQREASLQQTARKRQEFLSTESSVNARLNTRTLKLAVNGNSYINAGKTINIIYPPSGDRHGDQTTDDLISGKYLITACCHRFSQDGKYMTTIECTKDSYQQNIMIGDF